MYIFSVAEDDSNDAIILIRALKEHFPESSTHIVKDGAEAVEYLTGAGDFHDRGMFPWPDALITDLKMPRVSGLELLDWLGNHPEFRPAPCVLLSSSDDIQDIAQALELGAAGYFMKSHSAEGLQKLANLLRDSWTQHSTPQAEQANENVATATAAPITQESAPEAPLPPEQPTPADLLVEVGETEKHSLGCDVLFPAGMAFRMDGRNITPRFQRRNESRLEIYEADIDGSERLSVRVERERCSSRRSKLRVLANGRLLQVSEVCSRRSGRDTVFHFLLPGFLLVLSAYYSFSYKPEVADFYCEKFLGPRQIPAKPEKVPRVPRNGPLGTQKQKAIVSCEWQSPHA